jgi:hypothetical protein
MHAVSIAPHAKNVLTTLESENHRQNGFAMKKMKNSSGVNDTSFKMHTVSLKVEYIREFEAELKKGFIRESWAQGGLCNEKTEGRKFRDTVL